MRRKQHRRRYSPKPPLLVALVRVADFVTDPTIKKLLKDKDKDKKMNMVALVRQLPALPFWKR